MDKNEVVEDYKGLVYDIANDIKIPNSACLDQEDLYQLGFIGLLEACDKYNPDSDNDFSTFAYWRIRGNMLDGIRKHSGYSRKLSDKYSRLIDTIERLTQKEGYKPTIDSICKSSNISHKNYFDVEKVVYEQTRKLDFDGVYYNYQGRILSEVIPDDKINQPEEILSKQCLDKQRSQKYNLIKSAMDKLNKRQKKIIVEYYYKDRKLTDIGKDMGISGSRASQIKSLALDIIRDNVNKHRGN